MAKPNVVVVKVGNQKFELPINSKAVAKTQQPTADVVSVGTTATSGKSLGEKLKAYMSFINKKRSTKHIASLSLVGSEQKPYTKKDGSVRQFDVLNVSVVYKDGTTDTKKFVDMGHYLKGNFLN